MTAVGTLTVVLGPPELEALEAVQGVLAEWTEAGFVRPFLWCRGKAAGEQLASWSGTPHEEVNLLDEVAARQYERIGVVCALPLIDGEVPFGLAELSRELEEVLARRLGAAQRLSTLGVLIPASGVTEVPTSALVHHWRATVVAVDEDGYDPWHASRPVRTGADHATHAALAIAGAAGLWSGMEYGPFDDDVAGAGQQNQRVRLIRSYVRGARTKPLVPQIIDATLHRRVLPDWVAQLVGAEPAHDPDRVVATTATEFFDGVGVRLRREPYTPLKTRRWRISPGGALRMLWLFATGRLSEIQGEFTHRISAEVKARTELFVQKVTFGADSEFVVRFDGGGEIGDAGSGVFDVAQALTELVDHPGPPRRFGEEWTALRTLGTGLIDGGPLPDRIAPPVFGTHREIVEPGMVCPGPGEPDTPVPEWLDQRPESMLSRVGHRITRDRDAAGGAFVGALRRLREAVAALSTQAAPNRVLWYIWLAVAGVSGIGVVTGVTLGTTGTVPPRPAVALVVACLAVFVCGSAILMSFHLRREFQAAHRINQLRDAYEDARLEAVHEAGELVRLTTAAAEYEDWAVIIGRLLHPTSAAKTEPGHTRLDLAELPRPWAFGIADAETDPALLARLAGVTGRRCFRPGWLGELATRTIEQSMASLKFEQGLSLGSADPDPGTDAPARRKLRADVLAGAADRALTGEVKAVIDQLIPELRMDELFSTAHPVGGEPVAVSDFLTAVTIPELPPAPFDHRLWAPSSGYPQITTSAMTWLPEGVGTSAGATAMRVDLRGCADGATLISVRLEQTPPVPYGDLALFERVDPDAEEVPAVPDGVG